MNMIEIQFMKLVLKALYIIIITQQGYRVKYATWATDYNDFLEILGE